jgi:RNA polymerase sigma-70 factor, ECF subfamily
MTILLRNIFSMYKDHETPRFWITYAEPLEKYISKRVKDKMLAEDVLHDVYLKIYSHCKRFDFCCQKAGVKNLRSWVFQTCHNTLIDYYKIQSKYFYRDNIHETEAIELPSLKEDKQVSIEHLLNQLPKKYSEPLIYEFCSSMKQSEIAEKIGLSLPATKSRILRGKQLLAERYAHVLKTF